MAITEVGAGKGMVPYQDGPTAAWTQPGISPVAAPPIDLESRRPAEPPLAKAKPRKRQGTGKGSKTVKRRASRKGKS